MNRTCGGQFRLRPDIPPLGSGWSWPEQEGERASVGQTGAGRLASQRRSAPPRGVLVAATHTVPCFPRTHTS